LWIIVDNAMEYNHPGDPEAIFEVADTGAEIPEHELPKIF
jgi:signal transduction histidine kinase